MSDSGGIWTLNPKVPIGPNTRRWVTNWWLWVTNFIAWKCLICVQFATARSSRHGIWPSMLNRFTKRFSCTVCPKAFARREYLKIHVKNVHEKVKDHICQICATSFGESSSLDRHVKSVHESRKCFKCTACPKVFFYKNSLKSKPIVSILSSKYSPVKFVTKNLVEKILLISTRKVFMKIWEMLNVNFAI